MLAPPSSGALRPVVDFEAGGSGMLALVELGGRDAATLASAAVALELAESADGATLLAAWVDGHPDDTRALFATLALLFDGFSRQSAGGAKAEEQQRLRRYARAYIDGKGPNREVVERWLRYLDSRSGG